MIHSPGEVFANLLVANGIAVWTNPNPALWKWQLFMSVVPEDPNELLTIYNTQGLKDSRDQHSLKTLIRPAFQIMSRSLRDDRGFRMLSIVQDYLETVIAQQVNILARTEDGILFPATNYKISAVNQTGNILSAGQDDKRRFLNTINCIATISQL